MRRRGIIGSGGKTEEPDYFYVENISGTNTIQFKTPNNYFDFTQLNPILEFSIDNGETWSDWGNIQSKSSSKQRKVTLSGGKRVLIRAKTTNTGFQVVSGGQTSGLRLTFSGGACKIGGNIMYLLDCTGKQNTISLAGAFGYFFWRNSSMSDGNALVDASDLRLPAITIPQYAYYRMFYQQSNLQYAPAEISATSMSGYACEGMFYNNSKLNSAPYIKATSITGSYNLSNMFYNCYYVQEVHMDIASATSNNFGNWLYSATARSGHIYCPSALSLPTNSDSGVPKNWTRHNI